MSSHSGVSLSVAGLQTARDPCDTVDRPIWQLCRASFINAVALPTVIFGCTRRMSNQTLSTSAVSRIKRVVIFSIHWKYVTQKPPPTASSARPDLRIPPISIWSGICATHWSKSNLRSSFHSICSDFSVKEDLRIIFNQRTWVTVTLLLLLLLLFMNHWFSHCFLFYWTKPHTHVWTLFPTYSSLKHVCSPRLINHCHWHLWQLEYSGVYDSGSPLHLHLLVWNKNIPLIWFIVSQQHTHRSVDPTVLPWLPPPAPPSADPRLDRTLRLTNLGLFDHKLEETEDEFHFMWVHKQLCRILMVALITFSLHLQDDFLS